MEVAETPAGNQQRETVHGPPFYVAGYSVAHHPFTHEQATPSGDFLEKNHENLS